jgi:hypothetical protein
MDAGEAPDRARIESLKREVIKLILIIGYLN